MIVDPRISESEPLARHTSFRIGGPSRWFFRVQSVADVRDALQIVRQEGCLWYIIGGGSNVLAHDQGFDGMVIKIDDRSVDIRGTVVEASAGMVLSAVARASVDAGLSGLEWAYGIPGTVGGAVRGNAGAFGHSVADVIESVEILNSQTGALLCVAPNEMKFAYRRSACRDAPLIVTKAVFHLMPSSSRECDEALRSFLEQKKQRQPLGAYCAGSIFKNPAVTAIRSSAELPIEFFRIGRVPAGYLIEKANMKNHLIGRAVVSPKHANFIVNLGGATSADVVELIDLIKQRVHDIFGVMLEEEIQYLGFENSKFVRI